jgi:hypothetical protein
LLKFPTKNSVELVTPMKRLLFALGTLVLATFSSAETYAADGFDSVRCNAPVPAALIGKHMSNEPVMATESRHKAIALKDLGASEINDHLNAISWMICGAEYMLLQDGKDIVRDVLPFPTHSRAAPEFLGTCQVNGKDTPEQITAVLDNTGEHAGKPQLPATHAWRIDEGHAKFVPMATAGLACPRDGIITADGGM